MDGTELGHAGNWLGRLWPRRLAGQMIALLLLGLILAQTVSFLIFTDERFAALRTAAQEQVLARTASIVRLIESTPDEVHRQITRTASNPKLRFWLSARSPIDDAQGEPDDHGLTHRLLGLLGDGRARQVLVDLDPAAAVRWGEPDDLGHRLGRGDKAAAHAAASDASKGRERAVPERPGREHWRRHGPPPDLVISISLEDGQWLNAGVLAPDTARRFALPSLLSALLSALALSVIVILMVRRITRPMAALATAAERVGRGETVAALPEAGPLDVRQTTRAFNRMHDRLQRFVQDRTRMLAAISHDLRTPITTLRLRAEFVEDEETRLRILETLDEMQRMTEATLAFAREEAAREDTRTIDLAALIDSLCQDLADLGLDVTFAGAAKTPFACRPVGLKRAVRNLIENAVAYGKRARVALEATADEFRIVIEDDGPGIAVADRERVFQPFVRLEESRSAETGGIGLGMAIARSIGRGHGGDIELADRPGGGLRVVVRLPRVGA